VEVDLSAIKHNIREIKRHTKGLALMPVVKANAYGHGLVPVAKACEEVGVEYIGVVACEEALALRKAGIKTPLLVLSYVGVFLAKDTVLDAIRNNIDLTVFDLETAHFISNMARRLKKKAKIHMKIDTGTTRLGVYPKEFFDLFEKIQKLPGIQIAGVFTHFARAEETDPQPTRKQSQTLKKIKNELVARKTKNILFHAACSAALMTHPESFFSLGRLGISLYGLWPSWEIEKKMSKIIHLKPALSWRSKVIQVKRVKKGTEIGYGATYRAPRDMMLAVIACGYADGFDRSLSNKAWVLINGKKAPVRGRVCMNIIMVEVTNIKNVHPGSKVTLVGRDGKEEISATSLARIEKTINYEVVTQINWTIPRFYKKRP
jgi:alanine racemase